jgi:hypothetical protein
MHLGPAVLSSHSVSALQLLLPLGTTVAPCTVLASFTGLLSHRLPILLENPDKMIGLQSFMDILASLALLSIGCFPRLNW